MRHNALPDDEQVRLGLGQAPEPWMENFTAPDGTPRPVTKVVFEQIGNAWRWTVWSGARRLVSFPVTNLNDLLTATAIFVKPDLAMDPRFDAVANG